AGWGGWTDRGPYSATMAWRRKLAGDPKTRRHRSAFPDARPRAEFFARAPLADRRLQQPSVRAERPRARGAGTVSGPGRKRAARRRKNRQRRGADSSYFSPEA